MNESIILWIVLVVGVVLSGPIALIIAIIALNKTRELSQYVQKKDILKVAPPCR